MPTTESQKRANTKWREANKEKYNALCAQAMKKHYQENKEIVSEYKKNWYNKENPNYFLMKNVKY